MSVILDLYANGLLLYTNGLLLYANGLLFDCCHARCVSCDTVADAADIGSLVSFVVESSFPVQTAEVLQLLTELLFKYPDPGTGSISPFLFRYLLAVCSSRYLTTLTPIPPFPAVYTHLMRRGGPALFLGLLQSQHGVLEYIQVLHCSC